MIKAVSTVKGSEPACLFGPVKTLTPSKTPPAQEQREPHHGNKDFSWNIPMAITAPQLSFMLAPPSPRPLLTYVRTRAGWPCAPLATTLQQQMIQVFTGHQNYLRSELGAFFIPNAEYVLSVSEESGIVYYCTRGQLETECLPQDSLSGGNRPPYPKRAQAVLAICSVK